MITIQIILILAFLMMMIRFLANPNSYKTKAWQNDHVIYLDSASLYIAGGIQSYTKLMDKVSAVLDKSAPAQ